MINWETRSLTQSSCIFSRSLVSVWLDWNWLDSLMEEARLPFRRRQSNCPVVFFLFFLSSLLPSRALRCLWQWESVDRNHIHCSLSVSRCRYWPRGLRRLFLPVPLRICCFVGFFFFFFFLCCRWSSERAANWAGPWAVLGFCTPLSCQSQSVSLRPSRCFPGFGLWRINCGAFHSKDPKMNKVSVIFDKAMRRNLSVGKYPKLVVVIIARVPGQDHLSVVL